MRQEFKDLLILTGERRAKQSNFIFTPEAFNSLKKLIDTGVNKMTMVELQDRTLKTRAENNLVKLVEKMIEDSRERRLNERLDTRTFSNARMSICPLWPFC